MLEMLSKMELRVLGTAYKKPSTGAFIMKRLGIAAENLEKMVWGRLSKDEYIECFFETLDDITTVTITLLPRGSAVFEVWKEDRQRYHLATILSIAAVIMSAIALFHSLQ